MPGWAEHIGECNVGRCGKMKIWRAIRDPYVAMFLYNCPAFLHTIFHRPDPTSTASFRRSASYFVRCFHGLLPLPGRWKWWECQDPGPKNHETSTNLSCNQTWQGKIPHWKMSFLFRYQIIAIFLICCGSGWTSQEWLSAYLYHHISSSHCMGPSIGP